MDDNQNTKAASTAARPAKPLSLLAKLVALGLIILLTVALIGLPAVRTAREPARRNACLNNLKQISLGLSNYETAHGAFPPAYTVDADGKPLHSWRTLILPYMEQQTLFKQIDLSKPWDDPANRVAYESMPYVYQCPSDPTALKEGHNLTNYLAVVTPESAIRVAHSLSLDDIPEPSMTMLVIDAGPNHATHWMAPVDADEQLLLSLGDDSRLPHAGGIYLATFADGHGAAISTDCDPAAVRAQITATADDNRVFQADD